MAKKISKPIISREGSPEPTSSPQRPGTSGTELLLTTNRRTASANYVAAQRAEQAYKAKKRSAGARQHRADAKQHFKQSTFHLKEGIKSLWNIAAAVPWMIRGRREEMQKKREQKARHRDLEKRQKLEEKLAKQSGLDKEVEKSTEAEASGA